MQTVKLSWKRNVNELPYHLFYKYWCHNIKHIDFVRTIVDNIIFFLFVSLFSLIDVICIHCPLQQELFLEAMNGSILPLCNLCTTMHIMLWEYFQGQQKAIVCYTILTSICKLRVGGGG